MRSTIKHLGTLNRRFRAGPFCRPSVLRPLIFIVFILVCAGAIFAQEGSEGAASKKENAITLDLIPLFKGFLATDTNNDLSFFCISAAYERQIAPHFSIGPGVDLYLGKAGEEANGDNIPYSYFSIAVAGRYYPMSEQMEKLFIGALLGFNVQSIDGKTKEEDGGFAGPLIGVTFGYKVLLGEAFFLEPSMSYIYAKYNGAPTPIGWTGGLRIGIQF